MNAEKDTRETGNSSCLYVCTLRDREAKADLTLNILIF